MSQTHRSSVPRPTMPDLISMKRRDGSKEKLEIIRWISSHTSPKCDDFAHMLLNNRLTVRELRKECSKDNEFVRAVLEKWLSRDDDCKKGSLPCTWDTLVQCVDKSGLDGDFLKLLKDNVPTGTPTEPSASGNRSSDRFFYHVSAQYRRDFVNLQNKFGDMFDKLRDNVKSSHVPVDDLKHYLCDRFRELKTDVQDAGTKNDVMEVVRNECTLAEYSYLEVIADKFDLQEAKESIKHYRSTLDDFCKHTLEEHSYAKSFHVDHPEPIIPSSNQIEVTFKLEWNAMEKSLRDVRDVLRMAFGPLTDRVKIMVIKDGSVVIVCWAPQYLMMELAELAKSKLDQLKEIGLVELTVGFIELISEKVYTFGTSQTTLESLSVPRPTMSDLISMKMRDASEEKLKIMEWISLHESAQCTSFAHMLLNDRLSVKKLRKEYSKDDEFVQAVLDKWVSRDDDSKKSSLPCTWDTLVQCVDESGLDGDFLKLLKDNVPTGSPTTPESPSPSPPPTKKPKSQPTDPVTSYAQYLKYRYRQPLPDDDKLLTTPSKYYIELAVVSSEGILSRESTDEFTRKTLHGLTEEIMRKKTPIALENILKPREDGKPVRCVLVEGAPGAGKSALAWELCHKWEELECTKHYDLVVLVQLREKRAQEATRLSHMFPKFRSNMDDTLASIAAGNGQGILVVLDGFDGLPHEQREENSVYIELIKGDLLPEATVVITSRPSMSADLLRLCQRSIDRRLEVLGFTPEQIEEYARSVFGDGEEFKSFIQYINSNPVIKGMMYLPFNAVIVASVFKYSHGRYSKTMTQLYDALTRSLIRRYLAEKGMISADYRMPDSLQNRESINKLPAKVAEQLVVVARVAYMGLCEEKYVFTDLGVEFDSLDMMEKTTSLDVFGPTCSFSFLHLTLQEYLSALYISLELCSGLEVPPSVFEKNIVIRFLAGLCAHGNDIVYQTLAGLLQVNDLDSLLVAQCVYECDSIVKNIKVLQELFVGDKLIRVRGDLPFDCYAVGHCISHIGGRWSIIIGQQEEVDLWIRGLGSYDACSRGKIQQLLLGYNALLTFDPLVKLCCHDLHSLVLWGISCTESDASLLREYISPGRVLKVVNMILCHNVKAMLPVVFSASSLHSLALNTYIFSTINTCTVNLLGTNSNIKEFKMMVTNIDVFEQIVAALHNNTSLTLLTVDFFVCKPVDCIPILIKLLQSNHTLQELEVLFPGIILEQKTFDEGDIDAKVQLVEVAANSTSLMKLTFDKSVYEQLLSFVPKHYQYILDEGEYNMAF